MPNGVSFGFPRKASFCSLPQNSCEKLRHTEIILIGFKHFITYGYAGHARSYTPVGLSSWNVGTHVRCSALTGLFV